MTTDRDLRRVTNWDRRVGTAIRQCREDLGLTRKEVCEHVVGLMDTTLQNLEDGKQRVSQGALFELSAAMKITAAHVWRKVGLNVDAGFESSEDPWEAWCIATRRLFALSEQHQEMAISTIKLQLTLYEFQEQENRDRAEARRTGRWPALEGNGELGLEAP